MELKGKVVVAQGGGPTVINQSLVGAVLESRKFPQITKVYGAVNGVVRGIVDPRGFHGPDPGDHPQPGERGGHPSSALGSTRDSRTRNTARKSSRFSRPMMCAISSTSAAMTPPTPCASSMRRRSAPITSSAPSISPRPLTTTSWSTTTPPVSLRGQVCCPGLCIGVNLDNRALPGVHCGGHGRPGFLTAASSVAPARTG